MEYNNSSMNTRIIKGNRYTQGMDCNQNQNMINHTIEMYNQVIDPRQFVMNPQVYDYREKNLGYGSYECQRERDIHECEPRPCHDESRPCHCDKKPCHCDKKPCKKVCERADMTFTNCSRIGSNNTTTQCCDGTVAPSITAANSMPFAIQTYTVSDSIKFDRVATSQQPVILKGTEIKRGITVTGEPLEKGVFKFKVEEICFEDFDLNIIKGSTTLEGKSVCMEQKLASDSSLLVRSAVDTNCKAQCSRQGRGTNLQFNQNNLSVTINKSYHHSLHSTDEYDEAQHGGHPHHSKKIDVILKGSCGCTKIEVKTEICLPDGALEFSYPELTASLCRKANMNFAILDQLYKTKLTLGYINATIERTPGPGEQYKVEILNDVSANLLLRETVNLLNYELISVLGSSERVSTRDIPVTALDVDFDTCL
nr:hypothetical protein [uncultured Intestinibacter sp.]